MPIYQFIAKQQSSTGLAIRPGVNDNIIVSSSGSLQDAFEYVRKSGVANWEYQARPVGVHIFEGTVLLCFSTIPGQPPQAQQSPSPQKQGPKNWHGPDPGPNADERPATEDVGDFFGTNLMG